MESIQTKKQNMLLGAFWGDAFALGSHWIYDIEVIEKQFGTIRSLTQPLAGSYHTGKNRGDFTHYGDQTLLLLQWMSGHRVFDLQRYKEKWGSFSKGYAGYIDGSMKKTLANIAAGKADPVGSESKDLAGAGRIAPLLYYYKELGPLLDAVRELVTMTHNNELTVSTAQFFAKLTHGVLQGAAMKDALLDSLESVGQSDVKELIEKGIEASGDDSVTSLQSFGTACSIDQSLPGVIQILFAHGEDFLEAMTVNVMAGGDSAARGALIGTVLGASTSVDESIFQEMAEYDTIINSCNLV